MTTVSRHSPTAAATTAALPRSSVSGLRSCRTIARPSVSSSWSRRVFGPSAARRAAASSSSRPAAEERCAARASAGVSVHVGGAGGEAESVPVRAIVGAPQAAGCAPALVRAGATSPSSASVSASTSPRKR